MGHNQALRVGQFSMQILGQFWMQINSWLSANSKAVERVSLMMTDMQGLQSMDYATVSEAVRSLKLLSEEMEFT